MEELQGVPFPAVVLLLVFAFLLGKYSERSTGLKKQWNVEALVTKKPHATDEDKSNLGPALPDGVEVTKESEFPEDWLTSEKYFALERRAIFSKSWLFISHRSNFKKAGDYRSFEPAGFPILIILGKDNVLRGFHNVCRHRAYTVTKKAAGSSLVLGCRYHGWSYDTKGKLVKAPQFDGIEGFDKSQNSLFEIHTHVDRHGFVFVNLDAKEATPLEDVKVARPAFRDAQVAKSCFVTGWQVDAELNWKVAASCSTSTAKKSAPLAEMLLSPWMRWQASGGDQPREEVAMFPTTRIFTMPGKSLWVSVTISPIASTRTTFQCNLYSVRDDVVEPDSRVVDELKKYIDDWIATLASDQNAGDSKNTAIAQHLILDQVKAHAKQEQVEGREIHPAGREQNLGSDFERAERICQELDGLASPFGGCGKADLTW